MKVTDFTKDALAFRRDQRRMRQLGYHYCEPHWQLLRGGEQNKRITDVKVSQDGKHLWYKIGLDN